MSAPGFRTLTWSTSVEVLPTSRGLRRREGYTVVSSPSNPRHWWGNLLLFDAPPGPGDAARWEERFAAEFGERAAVRHRTFAWDTEGGAGAAVSEFGALGYEVEEDVCLTATPDELRPHARANHEVTVRALNPAPGADARAWSEMLAVQVAERHGSESADSHEDFARRRAADLRELFVAGRGDWYVALADGAVVAGCGIVVSAGRARYQAVDTVTSCRRRGICSRLLVDAARDAAARHGAQRSVICADPGYHALGLYESLGFTRSERTAGVCRAPLSPVRR